MTSSNIYILEGVLTTFDQRTKNRPYYGGDYNIMPAVRRYKIKNILNALKTTNTGGEN